MLGLKSSPPPCIGKCSELGRHTFVLSRSFSFRPVPSRIPYPSRPFRVRPVPSRSSRPIPCSVPSRHIPFSVPSHPVPFPVPSRPIRSRPVPSIPSIPSIRSRPPSRPVPTRPISSRPVPSRPVPSDGARKLLVRGQDRGGYCVRRSHSLYLCAGCGLWGFLAAFLCS